MEKLAKLGVSTPKIISASSASKTLYMEYINGITVSDCLKSNTCKSEDGMYCTDFRSLLRCNSFVSS